VDIDSFEVYFQGDKVFDSTLSAELLQVAGIACPAVSQELLTTCTAPTSIKCRHSNQFVWHFVSYDDTVVMLMVVCEWFQALMPSLEH
jgi:hypothetical protein